MDFNQSKDEIKTITLIVTEACNLNCSYCFEHHKSAESMTFATAKKIIDNEFINCDNYNNFVIDFFGGEPFLEFDLIQQIVEYVRSNSNKKNYRFFATTNGTLIHGEIKQWLLQQVDFICSLSIDGDKKSHNINRDNSFDLIDIDFFVKKYPQQGIKMTISQETLPYLYRDVLFLHKKGFIVNCNLAFSIDWSSTDNKEILEKQLKLLIDYYVNNPKIMPCSLIGWEISPIGYESSTTAKKWCGAGTQMFTFDVRGDRYPCQFFAPQSIGKELSQKSRTLTFKREIDFCEIDKKCRDCIYLPCCPSCLGSNYATTGDMYLKDDNLCKLTKIIIKARSYYNALMWSSGKLNLNEHEEQVLLRAIEKIQNDID